VAEPRLRLEVCSDPRALGVIRSVLRGWLEAFDLVPEGRRHEVVLAVDEACSNAMRHAYRGRCDESVDLVLTASEEWVEITVSDRGVPCPSECLRYEPPATPNAAELRPGGLGVRLIREVFDEVRFCPGDERGNCVVMRLRRDGKREVKR
jgi:anti-sigma regulatory factor (Ser/Thr protein kinase)